MYIYNLNCYFIFISYLSYTISPINKFPKTEDNTIDYIIYKIILIYKIKYYISHNNLLSVILYLIGGKNVIFSSSLIIPKSYHYMKQYILFLYFNLKIKSKYYFR